MEGFPDLDTREAIQDYLSTLAASLGVAVDDSKLATELDKRDELALLRSNFHVPKIGEIIDDAIIDEGVDAKDECLYFTGHSLGLQPKAARDAVIANLDKWAKKGFVGHFCDPYPWLSIEDILVEESARIVGAKPLEVVSMNGLTTNCHLAMVSFYRPTKDRYKILLESDAFPTDYYAVQSQVHWHGYDPKAAMVIVSPREGEHFWKTEDIVKLINEQGDSIALVWLSGIHYLTGYLFDMEAITKAAHEKGCYVGFDLAHAAGNVELHLHDWGVDVAAWCTYKYINSGPGGIAGFFVHEKHNDNVELPRLVGWWSHNRSTRLDMDNVLDLQPGASGFQLTNPPIFECLTLKASLDIFAKTSMKNICIKSRILTGYLEFLVVKYLSEETRKKQGLDKYITVVTPTDPKQRGAQLSLQMSVPVKEIHQFLSSRGALVDLRKDGHMRVCPAPLYNSFHDVWQFFQILKQGLD